MFPFKSAALAALLGLTATAGLAQEVTLRFQHFVSPKSANPTYFITPWAEKVEKDLGRPDQGRNLPLHATRRQSPEPV